MDHYLELFNTTGLFKQVRVPGGQTEGQVEATDIDIDPDPSEQDAESSKLHGQAYALPYQLEMERALREVRKLCRQAQIIFVFLLAIQI
jgi:hypothetical protein